MKTRCEWATRSALEARYHDTEWGVPSRDDRHLFEMLVLEGAQAGLSWDTILKKRDNYRRAFAGFDPAKVARFDRPRRERLLRNPGIVRNRLKMVAFMTLLRTQVRGLSVWESAGKKTRDLTVRIHCPASFAAVRRRLPASAAPLAPPLLNLLNRIMLVRPTRSPPRAPTPT